MSYDKDAWLVYNGIRSIKVDRNKVAEACSYFRNLLKGPFKESRQFTIDIYLGTAFSYDAFRCVIKYANDNVLYRDPDDCHLFIEAIQLAISWNYDKFVSIVEDHLIDRNINREEIDVLTRLAKANLPVLGRLNEACERYAESMARRDFIAISRCAIEHHRHHAYLRCVGPEEGELTEDDWEQVVRSFMTEEEKLELVHFREEEYRRTHKERRRDMGMVKTSSALSTTKYK